MKTVSVNRVICHDRGRSAHYRHRALIVLNKQAIPFSEATSKDLDRLNVMGGSSGSIEGTCLVDKVLEALFTIDLAESFKDFWIASRLRVVEDFKYDLETFGPDVGCSPSFVLSSDSFNIKQEASARVCTDDLIKMCAKLKRAQSHFGTGLLEMQLKPVTIVHETFVTVLTSRLDYFYVASTTPYKTGPGKTVST